MIFPVTAQLNRGDTVAPVWPEHFQPDVVREGYGGKLTSYTLTLEAWRRGLIVTYTSSHLGHYRITDGSGRSIDFLRSRPSLTTDAAVDLVNDKYRTVELLQRAGVPTPRSVLLDLSSITVDEVTNHAEEIGYPVVLKPLRGSMGKGVFANITNADQLAKRFADLPALTRGNHAVIESHMPGDDYRVLVVGDRFAGACKRVPANIVGDGKQTVEQLIAAKNKLRKRNPFLTKGLIKPDAEVADLLTAQGHTYKSVPARDEYVRLRRAANASAGGDVIDVSNEIPQQIKEAAIAAVQAVPGLFCAGVDVLYRPQSGMEKPQYCVLELNAHPQIGVNMYPTHGAGQDAPRHFLDACFPDSRRVQAPGDTQLTLPPLEDVLWPLRAGMVSEVTL